MINGDGSPPSSVSEEISEARRLFPRLTVLTATPSFLIATYERTPYARVKATITFPDGYPSHPLVVTIDQDAAVPPGLKKRLERELSGLASERAGGGGRHDQVRSVWERLKSFVDTNLFFPCWRELKRCVDLVQNSNPPGAAKKTNRSTLSVLSESKGRLRLSLHSESYFFRCTITIDPAYPDFSTSGGKACLLEMESTNFPPPIEKMLASQAQEIVRRMQEGLPSDRALRMSNPIKVPKNFHLDTEELKKRSGKITNKTIQNIKHDVEALKRVGDLRRSEASAVRAPGDNGYVDAKSLARERKDARRTIQKLTEAERAADRREEEEERERRLEEKKRSAGYYDLYDVPAGGTVDPQPSLHGLVTFLVEGVRGLVSRRCPRCEDRVLPEDPSVLNSMYERQSSKSAKKRKPMRTYCGCWYHKSCLNTFLTEPPFGLECPTENCGRRVFHPDWPGDIKQLEREWAARQARMRELEDAMLFL